MIWIQPTAMNSVPADMPSMHSRGTTPLPWIHCGSPKPCARRRVCSSFQHHKDQNPTECQMATLMPECGSEALIPACSARDQVKNATRSQHAFGFQMVPN